MDKAQGQYLAFLDGDDLFTPLALEKMYNSAQKSGADLVVGRTQTFNRFGTSYFQTTVQLSQTKNIDPFSLTLIWSFSQSNKLFFRKKVVEMGLRFPDKKYAEDGIFVLDFAHHSQKITGCPHDILLYRRRVLGEDYSATQTITLEMMDHYLEAYQEILQLSKGNFIERYGESQDNQITTQCRDYLEEIRYKEAKLFLDQFYRHFWRVEPENLKYLKKVLFTLKKELSQESWKRLARESQDLSLDPLVDDHQVMAENPHISIILNPGNCTPEELRLMLDSIFSQDSPSFEVLAFENVPALYQEFENLRVLDGDEWKNMAIEKSKGEYLWFVDDLLILGPSALRNFYNHTHKGQMEMVSSPLSQLGPDEVKAYPTQELVFLYRNTRQPNHRSKFNLLDPYLTNKIIKKDFLKKKQFKFTSDTAFDVHRLYQETKFQKVHHKNIYSFKDEGELIRSHKSHDPVLSKKTALALQGRKVMYQGIKLKRKIR